MSAVTAAVLVLLVGAGTRAAWLATSSTMTRHRLVEGRLNGPRAGRWRRPPSWVVHRTTQAGPAAQVLASVWPSAVAVAVSSLLASTVLFGLKGLMAAGAIIVVVPWLAVRRLTYLTRQRRARALPALLEDVARALRSGASLRQALCLNVDQAHASLRPQLATVCDALANGSALDVALDAWCEREPSEGLRLAVAALTLGIDVGGASGRALDGVAASLRERLAVDRELAALSSQARASAVVMVAAPVLFAAFAATADPRTAHFLLDTPTGLACLSMGLALDGLAAWWMMRLTGAVRCVC